MGLTVCSENTIDTQKNKNGKNWKRWNSQPRCCSAEKNQGHVPSRPKSLLQIQCRKSQKVQQSHASRSSISNQPISKKLEKSHQQQGHQRGRNLRCRCT